MCINSYLCITSQHILNHSITQNKQTAKKRKQNNKTNKKTKQKKTKDTQRRCRLQMLFAANCHTTQPPPDHISTRLSVCSMPSAISKRSDQMIPARCLYRSTSWRARVCRHSESARFYASPTRPFIVRPSFSCMATCELTATHCGSRWLSAYHSP